MNKKISEEAQAKAVELKKAFEEKAREDLINFLQDTSLQMLFHFYLGMEKLDLLKATNNYSKELKLHGNRFLKALEKDVATKIDKLYDNNPEFSTNMFQQLEYTAKKWSDSVLFADYPIINRMVDEFVKDPEHWRNNVVAQFNKMDSDIQNEVE